MNKAFKSPEFREFFGAVKLFFEDIQEMRHYVAIETTVA